MKFLKSHWPVLSISAIVVFLALINYRPGMTLTGVDNLLPEFNFSLNIKRSLFATWQEYQGLGVLGGMGHAADLIRQLMLWGASSVIPTHLIRYIFTLITLLLGGVGTHYLIRKVLGSPHANTHIKATASFAGALFYMFNLATLQQYYTPFEVFTVHFAALPWLFLVTINYFQKPERRNVLLLILTLLLATPQGYVPTLFVVWLMATTLLTLFLTIKKLQPFTFSATRFVKFYMLVLLVNAFWLLPFAYFTLTNAQVNVNAKINQMASENIYLLNKEFGNVSDVMILKGFWLQHVEPNLKGEITYSFAPWREHLENQYVLTLGYVFFGVICLGILGTIRSKK